MKHSLHITVHSAQLESRACAGSLVCCAQVASLEAVSPRARTVEAPVAPGSSGGSAFVSWEEEVALLVGPSARPQHLKLVLYANGSSRSAAGNSEQGGSDNPCSGSVTGGEYVAAGSLGLDTLLEAGGCGSGRQQFRVPMVDEVGRHAGDVSCTLRVAAASPVQAPRHAAC